MRKTMPALVKAQPGPGLELREIPVPTIGPHEVLVKVRAASICGTDLHIYRWDPWATAHIRPPLVVGHELCGDVVEVGAGVQEIREGDYISAESHVTCGICDMCRSGNGHLCRRTRILGVDRDGAFAEYVAVPAINAWVNPPEMPLHIATLQENFGNAVHSSMTVPLTARKVLVTGCGPVGLMTIAVAKASGARVIYATDLSPYRLGLAQRMGAQATLNPSESDVVGSIREMTEGEGVDVLLEMSGAPAAIQQGFSLLKPGGEAVLLGIPPGPFEFDLAEQVIFKGITIHGIIGRRLWETWYQARGLLRSGAVDLEPLVTHRLHLEDFQEAFALMQRAECGKVVFLMEERDLQAAAAQAERATVP